MKKFQRRLLGQPDTLTPPPHAPGVIPNWVVNQGCTDILVGGTGEAHQSRAFHQEAIPMDKSIGIIKPTSGRR
ncbi:hypothetical protein [Sporomusa carbonis]|uniref:hypothetical protein n=1 Tax=Sporomusa carbonis TaxID=3076075 RepID=UPI003C7BFB47